MVKNCFAERLLGSIRRECVDHLLVFGEQHLRRVLRSYAEYYNETRTHRSLNEDAPVPRPVQRTGRIVSHACRRATSPMRPNLSFRYTHGVYDDQSFGFLIVTGPQCLLYRLAKHGLWQREPIQRA